MSRRRYPIDTLALPYECDGQGCGCAAAYTLEKHTARPVPHDGAWEVEVLFEGMIVDVFRDASLNGALMAVHAAYPGARFDPEV